MTWAGNSPVWRSHPPKLAKKTWRFRPSVGAAEISLAIICSCVPRLVLGNLVWRLVAFVRIDVSSVLSLIAENESYGYQIRKRLAVRSHRYFQFGFGRLYPILHGLEQRRLVTASLKQFLKVGRYHPCGERTD